ncbi:DUF805 domain-containing protein [Cellulomonas sp. S1-8]|uniref:DUF805 domain-containing protein n=1 Tax=Cellulomonas sp. S1-8 TaxID=2904790 RepID=UPI002244292B|nr:DUF805 domain-containing protein [Cellulomonas sp. S1-8]UZN03031.1 DUF805 domain-containing protein [Cellulomonas sp. S1-8]
MTQMPFATAPATADDAPLPGATFGQAVGRFYGRYATFSGRASRSEYWWVALFFTIVLFGGGLLAAVLGTATTERGAASDDPGPFAVMVGVIIAGVLIASIVPSLALNARRLHDANLSGWLQLVCLIPSIGSLVMMGLAMIPSTPEGARYDKVPPPRSPYGY